MVLIMTEVPAIGYFPRHFKFISGTAVQGWSMVICTSLHGIIGCIETLTRRPDGPVMVWGMRAVDFSRVKPNALRRNILVLEQHGAIPARGFYTLVSVGQLANVFAVPDEDDCALVVLERAPVLPE